MSGGRMEEGGALLNHLRRQMDMQETALEHMRALRRKGQLPGSAVHVFALATGMPIQQVWELVNRNET